MMKEVFGQEIMTQFMKEVLAEGNAKGVEARCGGFGCGFCPILVPVAISIAAVEFVTAGVILRAIDAPAEELAAISDIIGNAASFEGQSAGKLTALCNCNSGGCGM